MPTKTAILTPADRDVARHLGHSLEDVEAFKLRQAEDEALEKGGVISLSGFPGTTEITAADRHVAKMLNHTLREVAEGKLRAQAAEAERRRLGGMGIL